MTHPPLQAIKCPKVRKKAWRNDTLCGGMIIPGKDFAFCHKCSAFFRVYRVQGRPTKLKEVPKAQLDFLWLLFEYEK